MDPISLTSLQPMNDLLTVCELVTGPTLVRLSMLRLSEASVLMIVLNEGHFILCLFILSDLVNQMSKINCEAK